MRELERPDKLEHVIEQQQKKHIKLIGSQRRNRSLILWSFNTETKELKRATFQEGDTLYLTSFNPDQVVREIKRFYSRVIVEKDCIYFQALNKKNALRKLAEPNY
jgi:hypothetical protein